MRQSDRFCLDAFAVATALEFQATLLTGDPEIKPLVGDYDLKVEWLPQPRASRTAGPGETQRDTLHKN